MVALLRGQGPQEEGLAPVLILALLAALVGAAAAGRAVPRGAARLVEASAHAGVAARGPAASQARAHHGRHALPGRGGRLGLDLQVLVSGQEVQVGRLTQVPGTEDRRSRVNDISFQQGEPEVFILILWLIIAAILF